MAGIFGFFFIIIIIILVFGISIISGVLRLLFGFGRKTTRNSNNHQSGQQEKPQSTSSPKHKKIFDKEDGEYVDFEEVKDDK